MMSRATFTLLFLALIAVAEVHANSVAPFDQEEKEVQPLSAKAEEDEQAIDFQPLSEKAEEADETDARRRRRRGCATIPSTEAYSSTCGVAKTTAGNGCHMYCNEHYEGAPVTLYCEDPNFWSSEDRPSCTPLFDNKGPIGAYTETYVWYHVCATEAGTCQYRVKGTEHWSNFGSGHSFSDGIFQCPPWSPGHPGYDVKISVDGVDHITDETTALAEGRISECVEGEEEEPAQCPGIDSSPTYSSSCVGSDVDIGSSCTLECAEGHTGHPVAIVCEDPGTWASEERPDCVADIVNHGTYGARLTTSFAYYQTCAPSTASVVCTYRVKGTAGWGTFHADPIFHGSFWECAPWTRGNPGYDVRMQVTTGSESIEILFDEESAIAAGEIDCSSSSEMTYQCHEYTDEERTHLSGGATEAEVCHARDNVYDPSGSTCGGCHCCSPEDGLCPAIAGTSIYTSTCSSGDTGLGGSCTLSCSSGYHGSDVTLNCESPGDWSSHARPECTPTSTDTGSEIGATSETFVWYETCGTVAPTGCYYRVMGTSSWTPFYGDITEVVSNVWRCPPWSPGHYSYDIKVVTSHGELHSNELDALAAGRPSCGGSVSESKVTHTIPAAMHTVLNPATPAAHIVERMAAPATPEPAVDSARSSSSTTVVMAVGVPVMAVAAVALVALRKRASGAEYTNVPVEEI